VNDTPDTGPATLRWDDDGQPLSSIYGDFYFSRYDGLAESRYVFLDGNDLPKRFNALSSDNTQRTFTIAETGFGSGLNFLASWQLWREHPRGNHRLHFISVEQHPLTLHDLTRTLTPWPELAPLTEQLTAQYPVFIGRGIQRLHFSDNVSLTLITDDANRGLQSLLWPELSSAGVTRQPRVNAWFLDGFSPSKNQAMWSEELFSTIASLSGPNTTAATFSAASVVKRGFKSAGFTVTIEPGYRKKREMVTAARESRPETVAPACERASELYYQQATHRTSNELTALVIGAGLAGSHTARALAESGWHVTVLEQHTPASGGSGNPQGLLYARLSHRRETLPRFNLHALMYAQRHYQSFWRNQPSGGEQCGLLQLANNDKQAAAQRQVVTALHHPSALVQSVDAAEASHLSGVTLAQGGLYFPDCGWLDPRQLCAERLDHPNIKVHSNQYVHELKQIEGHWHALTGTANSSSIGHAAIAVVACAERSGQLSQLAPLPLKPIRGQISSLCTTAKSVKLKTALCAKGYLAPAHGGEHSLGATFNLGENNLALNPQDHQCNLEHLNELGEHVSAAFNHPTVNAVTGGRAAFRCTTPDYLPVVGPVPDYPALKRECAALGRNAKAVIETPASYHSGLYVNCGHGSRGLAYIPLCAQLLTDIINRECAPLDAPLAQALHPARFALRDLIRGRQTESHH
jgi:tRNA 5-methylaminomethyl-2-thiouridine biosynthesis bifunctional protein